MSETHEGVRLTASRTEPWRYNRLMRVLGHMTAADKKDLARLDDNKGILTAWWVPEQDRCAICDEPHVAHPIVVDLSLHHFAPPTEDPAACRHLTKIWVEAEDEEFVEHRLGREGRLVAVAESGKTVEPHETLKDWPIGDE